MSNNNIDVPASQKDFANYMEAAFMPTEDIYPAEPHIFIPEIEIPYKLWRIEKSGIRYYYHPDTKNFHASVTSITSCEQPMPYGITDYHKRYGYYAEQMTDLKAEYGNMYHICITESIKMGDFDLSECQRLVDIYCHVRRLSHHDTRGWADQLKNDMAGFFQMMYDYNIEPIAVETPIVIPIYNPYTQKLFYQTAGTPDLIAWVNEKKWSDEDKRLNDPNRSVDMIDYKSGQKGFWESHEVQLDTYSDGWDYNMKFEMDLPDPEKYFINRVWNFAPKDSRGDKTTYKFKNQSKKDHKKLFFGYVQNFMERGNHDVKDVRNIEGVLKLGQSTSKNVSLLPADEAVKKRWETHNN